MYPHDKLSDLYQTGLECYTDEELAQYYNRVLLSNKYSLPMNFLMEEMRRRGLEFVDLEEMVGKSTRDDDTFNDYIP